MTIIRDFLVPTYTTDRQQSQWSGGHEAFENAIQQYVIYCKLQAQKSICRTTIYIHRTINKMSAKKGITADLCKSVL